MPVAVEWLRTRHGVIRIDVVTTAAGLVAFPVMAGVIGGVVAVLRTPSPALVSGVQHFAAGVVSAAVAGDVLRELRELGPLWLIVAGIRRRRRPPGRHASF